MATLYPIIGEKEEKTYILSRKEKEYLANLVLFQDYKEAQVDKLKKSLRERARNAPEILSSIVTELELMTVGGFPYRDSTGKGYDLVWMLLDEVVSNLLGSLRFTPKELAILFSRARTQAKKLEKSEKYKILDKEKGWPLLFWRMNVWRYKEIWEVFYNKGVNPSKGLLKQDILMFIQRSYPKSVRNKKIAEEFKLKPPKVSKIVNEFARVELVEKVGKNYRFNQEKWKEIERERKSFERALLKHEFVAI
jgi:hypothetical protein